MFDQLNMMLAPVLQNVDAARIASATSEHLGGMPHDELVNHVQTAAGNLQQHDPELAGALQRLVSRLASNPSEFKSAVTQFISSNPQILSRFAPEFTQGLLARL